MAKPNQSGAPGAPIVPPAPGVPQYTPPIPVPVYPPQGFAPQPAPLGASYPPATAPQYAPQPGYYPDPSQQYAPPSQQYIPDYPPQPQYTPPSPPSYPAPGYPSASGYPPAPGTYPGFPMGGGFSGGYSSINLGGVDDRSRSSKPLPLELDYEAEIMEAKDEIAKGTGNPMVKLDLVITYPLQFVGVKLWDNVVQSVLWKFKSLARSTETLDPTESVCTAKGPQDFIGHIVRFNVIHDNYQGAISNKVAGGYEPGWQSPGLSGIDPNIEFEAAARMAAAQAGVQPSPYPTEQPGAATYIPPSGAPTPPPPPPGFTLQPQLPGTPPA